MRRVSVDNRRADWPRDVANAINALILAVDWTKLEDFADDTAAAAGGVQIGQLYRTGSVVKVRVA
ncbi:hypothetical protein [Alteraurantiacibacter buctensis]|uniref:Uncharacterized protein n=1 Tax=Alteraurantiacibacter buctensis TaxID=1503981 RepID=A0A844Z144_9SPHN|nr:hypothetical protein [Alteraurantiacibacter buctensis]MXO72870.1 hypothetical protein [Alteraurantiacibacter buctensis]